MEMEPTERPDEGEAGADGIGRASSVISPRSITQTTTPLTQTTRGDRATTTLFERPTSSTTFVDITPDPVVTENASSASGTTSSVGPIVVIRSSQTESIVGYVILGFVVLAIIGCICYCVWKCCKKGRVSATRKVWSIADEMIVGDSVETWPKVPTPAAIAQIETAATPEEPDQQLELKEIGQTIGEDESRRNLSVPSLLFQADIERVQPHLGVDELTARHMVNRIASDATVSSTLVADEEASSAQGKWDVGVHECCSSTPSGLDDFRGHTSVKDAVRTFDLAAIRHFELCPEGWSDCRCMDLGHYPPP